MTAIPKELAEATHMHMAFENGKLIAAGWHVPKWKADIKEFYKDHAGQDIRIVEADEARKIIKEQW